MQTSDDLLETLDGATHVGASEVECIVMFAGEELGQEAEAIDVESAKFSTEAEGRESTEIGELAEQAFTLFVLLTPA